jgi:hypothetical protein
VEPSRRICVAIALGILVLAGACARDDELVEISYFAEWDGTTARVWIPTDEPRSIGTYRAEIEWPDGAIDRIRSERDGMIAGVWLADLESDGTIELIVALSSAGSGSYGSIHLHQHRDGAFVGIHVSGLDGPESAGYMGHDVFTVEGGHLYRTFPVYAEGDPNAAPSGGRVRLRYSFDEDAWIAENGSGE